MRDTDPSVPVRLGAAIAMERERCDLSVAELAAEAGCSPTIVRRIEAGALPSVRTLLALCDALGVQASDLLREAGA